MWSRRLDDGCILVPLLAAGCLSGSLGASDGLAPGTGGRPDDEQAVGGWSDEPGPKTERCGNAVDDDLDGLVDEGCPCVAGAEQECWLGPRFAMGEGICHAGHQSCAVASDGSLAWGDCVDAQLPVVEDCANGADDDCDGRPDCDDPDCAGACGGACASEERSCRDRLDDDCDGLTDCDDPDCADSCAGCEEQEWECYDGRDDDCNGLTDCEDPDCEGSCALFDPDGGGDEGCQDEDGCGEQVQDPPPDPPDDDDGGGEERCNGRDDDGDGRVDEGRVCGQADDGGSECEPGAIRICDAYCGVHQRCRADGTWGGCLVDALCAGTVSCNEHSDCQRGDWCDFGWCVAGTPDGWPCGDDFDCGGGSWCAHEQGVCVTDCLHHGDCGQGLVCDLGWCVADPYVPGACG